MTTSIRQQIARDVAIEFSLEALADFAAGAPEGADLGLWYAELAGRMASDLQHLLAALYASVPGLADHTAAACDTITKAATC